jgi:hypothetical protein
MMPSVGEHQEVPKEDAAVMPVGGLGKWRRDRNLASGRRQKPKGRIQASCESRRKSTVAGRNMTRRATVVWHKRNLSRKIWTQGKCWPRKRLTAAGIKVTRHARVAWRRKISVRNDWTRNKAKRGTPKRRKYGKRLLKGPECNNDLRDRGLRRKLQGNIEIKDPDTRRKLRPRIDKKSDNIFRGNVEKKVGGTSRGLRRMKNWTLWRSKTPPERKKKLQIQQKPVM